MKEKIAKLQGWYERNDTRVGLLFMASGFTLDSFTLDRIDLKFENVILIGYLLVALSAILLVNAYHGGRLQYKPVKAIQPYLTLPLQFAFGGLFSAYIIFYSRSASLIAGWPFLLMLAALLIGNEFARSHYAKLTYNVTVFYTALFSFCIFVVPVLTKRIGVEIFLLSGIISLFIIWRIVKIIKRIAPQRYRKNRISLTVAILFVYGIFNGLYFANIIPPIPLALKDAGVYHDLAFVNGSYVAQAEAPPWWRFYDDASRLFHRQADEPVYVYTAIFAPTDLQTEIFHRWSFFDQQEKIWIERDKLSYPINGGRDGGYRGYSLKRAVEAGKWRVDVVTDRDQLIGRINFFIENTTSTPTTTQITL